MFDCTSSLAGAKSGLITVFLLILSNPVFAKFNDAPTTYDNYSLASPHFEETSQPSAGLWIWTYIGKSFRQSFSSSQLVLNTDGGSPIEKSNVIKFLVPLIIFCAFMLASLIYVIIYGSCMCCCRRDKMMKSKTRMTITRKKAVLLALGAILVFCINLFAALCGIRSAIFAKSSTKVVTDNVDSIFTTSINATNSFNSVLGDIFGENYDHLGQFVDDAEDAVDSVDWESAETSFAVASTSLDSVETIQSSYTVVATDYNAEAPSISPPVSTMTDNLDQLNAQVSLVRTFTVQGIPYVVSVAPQALSTLTVTQPQGLTATSSVTSIASTSISSYVDTSDVLVGQSAVVGYSEVYNIATSSISSGASVISTAASNSMASILSTARSSITPAISKLEEIHDTVKPYNNDVSKYERIVSIVAIVLFCIPLVFILLHIFGFFAGNYRLVRATLYVSVVFYALCFIFTIVFAILSVASSKACGIAFDSSNGPPEMVTLSDAFFDNQDFPYDDIYYMRNSCIDGEGLWGILSDRISTLPNVTNLTTTYLKNQLSITDFTIPSSANAQIDNIHSALSSAQILSTAVASQVGAVETVSSAFDEGASEVDSVMTSFAAMATDSIVILPAGAAMATDSIVILPAGAAATVQEEILSSMIADLMNAGTTASTNIASASTTMSQVGVAATNLANVNDAHVAALTLADTAVSAAVDRYNQALAQLQATFDPKIQTAKTNLLDNVINSTNILYTSQLGCKDVGLTMVNVEVGLCDGIQLSFDGIFFSFFIFAVGDLCSLPFMVLFMRILRTEDFNLRRDGSDDDVYVPYEKPQSNWQSPIVKTSELTIKGVKTGEKGTEGASEPDKSQFIRTAVMEDWEDEEDNGGPSSETCSNTEEGSASEQTPRSSQATSRTNDSSNSNEQPIVHEFTYDHNVGNSTIGNTNPYLNPRPALPSDMFDVYDAEPSAERN